jgi:endonuclease/exonuclease/phosphatase family metal-dependent hydrolase
MKQLLFFVCFAIIATNANAHTCDAPKPRKPRIDSIVPLKVLTWNIQMLPRWAIKKEQKLRTKWIIEDLLKQDVDVIVFEEVFDVGIRGLLRLALLPKFPFQVGVQNKRWTWKQGNGVWVVSRVPLKPLKHIFFKDSYGTDGLANKGAVLVEGTKRGKKFQIAATHLQSTNDAAAQTVRNSQLAQIRQELLDPFMKENVPQLLIGDLNTPKEATVDYKKMLETVGMQDCPITDERPYTWDRANSWNTEYDDEKSSQLDYMLLNAQRSLTKIRRLLVYRPFLLLKNKKMDLADHYGVIGEIDLQ